MKDQKQTKVMRPWVTEPKPPECKKEAHPWRVPHDDFYSLPEVKTKLDDLEKRVAKLEPGQSLRIQTLKERIDTISELFGALMIAALLISVPVVVILVIIYAIAECVYQYL